MAYAMCRSAAEVEAPVTPNVDAGRQALAKRNFVLAKLNFEPLAGKGDAAAEGALGQLLMQRCTGLEDKAAGMDWLAKAADGGDAPAALTLGSLYLNGDGVAQDDNKAFSLISKAADAGIMVAETDLGYMYLNGRGVAVDKYQGMVWAVKAGEQGSPAALDYIANAYFKGVGLPQDTGKSAFYYAAAVVRATPQQRTAFAPLLKDISREMSPGDFKDQAVRAAKWSPGHGSLSDVLSDAAKWRKQNLANKN